MAHLHEVRDSDTHFVIDPITRAITNANSAKNTLMQGDHNSEIFTFEIPKEVEGHDMSQCNRVEIHYNDISADKANSSKDVYTVSDMQIAEDQTDTLVFSWLVSGNATKYAGMLSFRIRFGCVDENGVYTYKWHTDIFKGITISDGFDNTEAVIEEYSDAIAEWEAELDALEARITALEQGGTGGTVTDEQIAEAVGNYFAENPVEGGTVVVETFTTKPIGQLFDQPVNYSFWSPQTLAYDPNIDKYVDLIFGTTTHLAADSAHTLWVSYIDPKTYEATEPVQCVYMDGETTLTMPDAGCAAFIILDDGRYMQINRPSSASNDMYLFFSEDNGKTWVKGDKAAGFSTTNEIYFLTKLSNGRLLANSTANKVINYSDDGGLNWSGVTPTTCGGNMESEIFFVEVNPGVVIAIGRYSMSGIGYNASGDSQHAVISFSEDYGTTWTPWKLSETIDNMNASCCTGYLHDGLLELFCGSRWYYNGGYANTDYTNTGKTGAITHYTATVENALADNFTNAGVVVYAKAMGAASSQDFHTPCVAVNGKEMLMVYADRVYPYTTESTNHYFVRGYLGDSMDYAPNDEIVSAVFPYSSKKVRELLMLQKSELITLMNEAIMNNTPVTPDDVAVYTTDGLVMYFNMTDGSKYDADNLTVTDVAHGLTAKLIDIKFAWTALTALPEIREKSVQASIYFVGSNPLAEHITDEDTAFTLEWSMYQYSDLSQHPTDGWAIRSETNAGIQYYGSSCGIYKSTDGTTTLAIKDGLSAAGLSTYTHTLFPYGVTDTHRHCVMTFDSDGTVRWYKDGEKTAEAVMPDFLQWDRTWLSKGFRMGGNCRAMRIYKKALSDEEVLNNYEYEKQFFV